ncbi:MAG TPA: type II secretion system protein [Candidatus Binatus sp.]|nr:type II secretion system protein [Candidatus Binatus sp.]
MSRSRRGFTIIEALIAMVTLIGVMMVLVGTVPKVFNNSERDSLRIEAATAAQQYLDSLHEYVESNGTNAGLPAAPTIGIDMGDQYTSSTGSEMPMPSASPGSFTLTNNGCPFIAGSSRMYDCKVTNTWTADGQTRTLTVESYVTAEN